LWYGEPPVPAPPNPLFRKEIAVAQCSGNFGPHFALNHLPIRKSDRPGGQVIRPARLMGLVPQAVNQAPRGMNQPPDESSFTSTRHEPRSAAALTFAICGLASSGRFFVELSRTVKQS
jgi:hypothetical protein